METKSIVKSTLTAALLTAVVVIGCKPSTDPVNPATSSARKTGLTFNLPADIEEVAEAEFDDSLFIDALLKGGRGVATLPASFALDGPPILNQGETGKCGAFSAAYYIIGLYNGANSSAQNFDKVGSTDFAYSQYKKVSGDACGGEGGVLMFAQSGKPAFTDVLKEYGTTTWNQVPFKETNDCTPLTDDMVKQAAANRVADYRRIDKTDYRNPNELKAFLYGGFPLWIGVSVDGGWQSATTAVIKEAAGKSNGGHAMTIVGWDDTKQAYKVANSWGPDWADKGYGWVDYTHMAKLLDAAGGQIAVFYPSESQLPVFSNLSPGSCGKAGWGDIIINNKRGEQVSVEITGLDGKYANRKTDPTEAQEEQTYSGIPQGQMTVKIFDETKKTLLKTHQITVTKCLPTRITVE